MRILVVDDKQVNRNLLRQMLTRKGYEVLEAADGSEAIDVVQESDIDIVLMDIMMPGMNGYESAQKIKELSQDNYIPVIYVTALRAEESLSTALAAGGDDFISKPVNFAVLESKIKAHARIRELNQQLKEKNKELLKYNARLAREQELITYFFDNALKKSYLDPQCIKHHVSPMSAFNGDVLTVTERPMGGIYVMLGDFTGHGLTASMGTLTVAQTFFKTAQKGLPISIIAREINDHLYNLLPIDMFLAAILLEIPASADNITIWNGGMPDAYIVNNKQQSYQTVKAQHLPLGVVDESEFDTAVQMVSLSGGEKFYFFTDGIIETVNKSGEMFGAERINAILTQYNDNSFEMVIETYIGFKGNIEQKDDITFVEIDCDNVPKEANTDSEHQIDQLKQSIPLHVDVSLCSKDIRDKDPVKQVVDLVSVIPALKSHRDTISALLSELYINALEHGVLKLESKDKTDDDAFIQYYNEKEKALAKLEDGSIRITVDFTPEDNAGELKIRIHDSGSGFDSEHVATTFDAPFGRGLLLASSLCEGLNFENNGSIVEAVYKVS